jgi:branched-chain amino acid transport system permease protein
MTANQRMFLNAIRSALVGIAIALAAGPLFLADTQLGVLTDFFSVLVLAILWNLLAGYADIATIGQHAFVGVGAYAFYAFAALAGVDPYLSIPLAGVVALIVAAPAMALLFRLRTAYLSIGTWVVAEVLMLGAGKIEAFGGGSGISVPIEILRAFGATRSGRLATTYWLAFALAIFALGSTYLLLRSRFGLGLMAMRDNEESAASVGVNTARARVLCFLGVAPVLGMTGAIITLQKLRIAPQASFSIIDWSVLVTFIVVIGGIGTIEGPIVGTIFFFVLREYLSDLGTWHLILLGVFSIAIIVTDRRGLWGLIRRFALRADLVPTAHRSASQKTAMAERARVSLP